jgi:Flp pilus assembly protein TadG
MALVTPLLILLMFGAMEMGHYFYSQHVVVKAVRDGARFASREGFDDFTCPDQIDGTVKSETQNVTRTDQVADGGSARLPGWTDNSTVDVSLTCDSTVDYQHSIYEGLSAVPVVKVTATVPYMSLFSLLGFGSGKSIQLIATSQAPVMGA